MEMEEVLLAGSFSGGSFFVAGTMSSCMSEVSLFWTHRLVPPKREPFKNSLLTSPDFKACRLDDPVKG